MNELSLAVQLSGKKSGLRLRREVIGGLGVSRGAFRDQVWVDPDDEDQQGNEPPGPVPTTGN
jgi:hypothetical protein